MQMKQILWITPNRSKRVQLVLALIDELGESSAAFVVVTHDPAIAAHMNRTLELRSGVLESSG